jgi:hypothetical protein
MPRLASLTFEPGSQLKELEEEAFWNYPSLKSIPLPALVSIVSGHTFVGSAIATVVVDEGNPNYSSSRDFLVGLNGMILLRHLRQIMDVKIGREYGAIGEYCFSARPKLSSVCFEGESSVTRIGPSAFYDCPALRVVRILASVETLGDFCFGLCRILSVMLFEDGSRLTEIGASAFLECPRFGSPLGSSTLRSTLSPGAIRSSQSHSNLIPN